ncbi:WhiB family transcriptional regulator [Nocardioides sp. B-3]|uniref:WhiB family transcriptional regulator n=1 Tax=Nocardioides sp. B-3 TaxID=2895565 RepID=UPI003FA577E1
MTTLNRLTSEPRIPTGIRGLFVSPTKSRGPLPEVFCTSDQVNEKEVTHMTISVLDRNRADEAVQGDLGDLHDAAAKVDDELLPCRTNDAELWFAESPSDVEYAKTLCQDCPVQGLVPQQCPRTA